MFSAACSSSLLTAHYLLDQSYDDHQDTASDPGGCNLTDDRTDVEACSAGSRRFRSPADQGPMICAPIGADNDPGERVADRA